jgi:acyl-coenzyme A synthetase/AMP-(fatty) acid ligase
MGEGLCGIGNSRRDEDGYYWITGRVDDVINVSGHRIGTAEVESALVAHPSCAEAAVVGFEHPVKGQVCCLAVLYCRTRECVCFYACRNDQSEGLSFHVDRALLALGQQY